MLLQMLLYYVEVNGQTFINDKNLSFKPSLNSLLFLSTLCSHCLSRKCLQLWCLLTSYSSESMSLIDADLDCILSVINVSWAQGMHKMYGAGLLVFHTFYNTHSIPDSQHCLAS